MIQRGGGFSSRCGNDEDSSRAYRCAYSVVSYRCRPPAAIPLTLLGMIRFPSTVEYEAAIVAAQAIGSSYAVGAQIHLASTRSYSATFPEPGQRWQRHGATSNGSSGLNTGRHLDGELVIEEYLRGDWDAAEQRASRSIDDAESSGHWMGVPCHVVRGQIRIGR